MKFSSCSRILTSNEFIKWLDAKEITRSIRYIQNFYAIIPFYARFDGKNYLQILKEIEIFQAFKHGYDEIAQNMTVFPDGKIALGRDINKIPPGINGTADLCVRVEYILNPGNELQLINDELTDYNTWLNTLLCMKLMIRPSSQSIIAVDPSELVSGKSFRLLTTEIYPS
jgi:hypothetical protein